MANQYSGLNTWTPERIAILRKLWAAGLSCSQIAARIGGISRNAVIGKASRLGLAGRISGGKKGQGAGQQRPKNDKRHILNNILTAKLRREAREYAIAEALKKQPGAERETARKTLQELEPGDCRFIADEPTGRCFCAKPVLPGTSYCPQHFMRTHSGASPSNPSVNRRETTEVMA